MLDADDLGAEIGEHAGGRGPGDDPGEVADADAFKGESHGRDSTRVAGMGKSRDGRSNQMIDLKQRRPMLWRSTAAKLERILGWFLEDGFVIFGVIESPSSMATRTFGCRSVKRTKNSPNFVRARTARQASCRPLAVETGCHNACAFCAALTACPGGGSRVNIASQLTRDFDLTRREMFYLKTDALDGPLSRNPLKSGKHS